MTYELDWESSGRFLASLEDVWEAACREVFPDREPWYNSTLAMRVAQTGKIRAYVAREDGFIVGWASYQIGESWFQKGVTASCVTLFVLPQHRGGNLGIRLLRESKDYLIATEVDRVVCCASLAGCPETRFRSARAVFRRAGFTPSDEMWEVTKNGLGH